MPPELPSDILRLIFDHLPQHSLLRVARVSRLWLDTAVAHPTYWRYISIQTPLVDGQRVSIRKRLLHKPTGDLHVHVRAAACQAASEEPWRSFLIPVVLKPCANRFVSLKLDATPGCVLETLRTLDVPQLREYHLDMLRPEVFPVDIFRGSAPSLRIIVLKNVILSPTEAYPAFSSAEDVQIAMQMTSGLIPMTTSASIMAHFPLIVRLKLDHFAFVQTTLAGLPPIPLMPPMPPNLRTLEFALDPILDILPQFRRCFISDTLANIRVHTYTFNCRLATAILQHLQPPFHLRFDRESMSRRGPWRNADMTVTSLANGKTRAILGLDVVYLAGLWETPEPLKAIFENMMAVTELTMSCAAWKDHLVYWLPEMPALVTLRIAIRAAKDLGKLWVSCVSAQDWDPLSTTAEQAKRLRDVTPNCGDSSGDAGPSTAGKSCPRMTVQQWLAREEDTFDGSKTSAVKLKCPRLATLELISQTANTVIVDGEVVTSFLEEVLDGPSADTVDLHLRRVWTKSVFDGCVEGFRNVTVFN